MSEVKWERVNTEHGRRATEPTAYTDRLKVPGGWLYRCIVKTVKAHSDVANRPWQSQYEEEISLCFVPDPTPQEDNMTTTTHHYHDEASRLAASTRKARAGLREQ